MKRNLAQAAAAVGGVLHGADATYDAVSSDSRTLPAGALFVALRGPNFDGGEFVAAAAARGAVAALVERLVDVSQAAAPGAAPGGCARLAQIVVPDTLRALQQLGRAWRASFSIPVIAVGGSNGKTSVKEMTAAILRHMGPTLATAGNLNNHIGVPLTLMRLDSTHRSAVIEMGANRIGDVAELVDLAAPTVGLITNAGAEHLEGFGDLDGVARGEGEMVAGLASGAVAVINADDPYAAYWRGVAKSARVVSFGVEHGEFTATHLSHSIENGGFVTRFALVSPLGEIPITLHAGGSHNIQNALGAAAAAGAAGASLEQIAAGLGDFRPVAGRLQLKSGLRGSWLIDDSYNANPSSVKAGIDVLRAAAGARWLLVADMAELGEHSADAHAEIGSYARAAGIARVFALGEHSARAVETFGSGGEWFNDVDSLTRRLQSELAAGVTLLIKGSRVNRLERVVQALLAKG